jgi:hypothetical protein
MKKTLYIILLSFVLGACGSSHNNSYRRYDIRDLKMGMYIDEVESMIGPPERILSIRNAPYGYEEVLQFRNYYNKIYALEFLDGYLVCAHYIYNDYYYPMYPPNQIPPRGKPVVPPHYKPNHPTPPPGNSLPSAKPRDQKPASKPTQSGVSSRESNKSSSNTRKSNTNSGTKNSDQRGSSRSSNNEGGSRN